MLPCELYEGVCQCHIPSVNGGQSLSHVLPLKTTGRQHARTHTHPLPCLAVPTHETIHPCSRHGPILTSTPFVKLRVLRIHASQLRVRGNKGDAECQRQRSVISQTWLVISLATLIFAHTNQKFQSHETLGMQRGSG